MPDAGRLVARILAGDQEAEQELVLWYQPRVEAMLRARTRDWDLASDLRQEVMIAAICALRRGSLREPEKLPGFILGIARNLLNNHFRRDQSSTQVELPDDLPAAIQADSVQEEQEEQFLREALDSLDPVSRQVLWLTLVQGEKPTAIAHRLRLSTDVVRQRKTRAVRKVSELLEKLSQRPGLGYLTGGDNP